MRVSFTDLDGAAPDELVVVVDVLRAFTTVPWMYERGAVRVLAVDRPELAMELRDELVDGGEERVVLAGEDGGRQLEGFDLGNSPTDVAVRDLTGTTVVHRTSAGTQGLVRCLDSRWLFAASFVNAVATVAAVHAREVDHVTFVVTGASLGRDGDEDLACAELLAARLQGRDPDPAPFLARVPTSDAGRVFGPGGPDWAPASDLEAACELDRFTTALIATPAADGRAVAVEIDAAHP